jgi:hypothetical protein
VRWQTLKVGHTQAMAMKLQDVRKPRGARLACSSKPFMAATKAFDLVVWPTAPGPTQPVQSGRAADGCGRMVGDGYGWAQVEKHPPYY